MKGGKRVLLDEYSIKQIGGRAGRFTQDGYITAFAHTDLQQIRKCIGVREQKGGEAFVKTGSTVIDIEDDDEEDFEEDNRGGSQSLRKFLAAADYKSEDEGEPLVEDVNE